MTRFLLVSVLMVLQNGHSLQEMMDESSQIHSVKAPSGGAVELVCDVTPALPDDPIGLVIWYKQGHEAPIYSFDLREGVTSHYSDPTVLGSRATFRSEARPAILVLSKLRPEDTGQYRCRVDFLQSPTKNTFLNLTILIPPERLIILDHKGKEIVNGVFGPYNDGTEANLTCVAVGGRPTARVSWWKSHALLANAEGRATVALTLRRADLNHEITCQAVTDPGMDPVSKTLIIDVNLRPLWVRLQGGRRPLTAGRSTELVCQVVGARPRPSISWWKGGTKVNTARDTTSSDGNITTSVLSFVPSIEDAGRMISCRSSQPELPMSTQEDGWKMEIQHIPLVRLELGANLDGRNVVEGSDVYLDCRARANPWIHSVYFTHNGAVVKSGPGTLLANQSLVLQGVSRKSAGAYVCAAKNDLGEGFSDKLVLDVKFAPTCVSGQAAVVRAARGETFPISCAVDANPTDNLVFNWWFNNSAHSKQEMFPRSTSSSSGTFIYTVNTSSDYGWVQCSGQNSIGRQTKPCLYHILPADKPSPVKGCEVTNVTYESLTMNCTPGHDGGVTQSFLLQIFEQSSGALVRNVSSDTPEFLVTELSAGQLLSLAVRAYNRKGVSDAITLTAALLKYPQRHTAQIPMVVQLTPLLACVLGVLGVVLALLIMGTLVVCCRRSSGRRNVKEEKVKRRRDETSNMPLTSAKETDSVDSLDKNPDIIPLDGKISDNSSNKSSTADYSSIRPLITKAHDKYDPAHSAYDRYSPLDHCNQYIQIRPVDYRVRNYPPNSMFAPIGQNMQSLPPMGHNMQNVATMGIDHGIGLPLHGMRAMGNDPMRPYDKVYEDWLKYKNALPLNTSGLLPAEQLLPPDMFAQPLYSQPNKGLALAQMPELDRMDRLEQRSCSNSPPVRFAGPQLAFFSKGASTLPHLPRRVNGTPVSQSSPVPRIHDPPMDMRTKETSFDIQLTNAQNPS